MATLLWPCPFYLGRARLEQDGRAHEDPGWGGEMVGRWRVHLALEELTFHKEETGADWTEEWPGNPEDRISVLFLCC